MSKIKLLVEIDEEDYGDFCDWFESVPSSVDGLPCVKGKFNTALYDAKPVDTSGDLISREDLKEKLKERYYNGGLDIVTAIKLIDSATPVPDRPKGEWIGECYDPECDQCHTKPLEEFCDSLGLDGGSYVSIPMFFCPNCGADMRKGGAE